MYWLTFLFVSLQQTAQLKHIESMWLSGMVPQVSQHWVTHTGSFIVRKMKVGPKVWDSLGISHKVTFRNCLTHITVSVNWWGDWCVSLDTKALIYRDRCFPPEKNMQLCWRSLHETILVRDTMGVKWRCGTKSAPTYHHFDPLKNLTPFFVFLRSELHGSSPEGTHTFSRDSESSSTKYISAERLTRKKQSHQLDRAKLS